MKSNYDPKNPVCQACCTAIVDYQEVWWCKHVRLGGLQMLAKNCKKDGYRLNLVCKIDRIKLQLSELDGYPDKMRPALLPRLSIESGLIERYAMGWCEYCGVEYAMDWTMEEEEEEKEDGRVFGPPPCPTCGEHHADVTFYYRMRKDKTKDKKIESEALNEDYNGK